MIRVILFFVFCFHVITGAAQSSNKDILTRKAWKILSDEMSGIGVHASLNKETQIQFFTDGTWKSSQPIKETVSGTWRLDNQERNLVLKSETEEISYLILKLTENELHYRVKKNAATYSYKWAAAE